MERLAWWHLEETMNIPGLTNDALIAVHQLIAKAQAADDAAAVGERRRPFGVRDYSEWRRQADAYEAEMNRRRLGFTPIDWTR
jgi:hypothetical protein